MAVLLGRPHEPNWETVNDINGYLTNAWRAIQQAPLEVAKWADAPVNELDLHAKHWWLRKEGREIVERLNFEPDFYDAKVAGWWLWGISNWIGGNWCDGDIESKGSQQIPHLLSSKGVVSMAQERGSQKKPALNHLRGVQSMSSIEGGILALSARLKKVRICCGDWKRVVTPSITFRCASPAGVFLDPPYEVEGVDVEAMYGMKSCSNEVREWAIENGDDPRYRIALCGYEGEHGMPDGWECVAWKANGGYGGQANSHDNPNAKKERIWFSPHCLKQRQSGLFEEEN